MIYWEVKQCQIKWINIKRIVKIVAVVVLVIKTKKKEMMSKTKSNKYIL